MIVLFTAAVSPQGASIERSKQRLDDYRQSLEQLCTASPPNTQIVVTESTGSCRLLQATVEDSMRAASRRRSVELEFVAVRHHIGDSQSKGALELDHIEAFLQRSELERAERVVKLTGRLTLTNAHSYLTCPEVCGSTADLVGALRRRGTWFDSRCFAASVGFLSDYIVTKRYLIDDDGGVFLEHILADARHELVRAGGSHAMPSVRPRLRGTSGGTGMTYHRGAVRDALLDATWQVIRWYRNRRSFSE